MLLPAQTSPAASVPPQGFSIEADRKRLSTTALKAFRRLVMHWDLTSQQAAAVRNLISHAVKGLDVSNVSISDFKDKK